jgi:hypothetical protein
MPRTCDRLSLPRTALQEEAVRTDNSLTITRAEYFAVQFFVGFTAVV